MLFDGLCASVALPLYTRLLRQTKWLQNPIFQCGNKQFIIPKNFEKCTQNGENRAHFAKTSRFADWCLIFGRSPSPNRKMNEIVPPETRFYCFPADEVLLKPIAQMCPKRGRAFAQTSRDTGSSKLLRFTFRGRILAASGLKNQGGIVINSAFMRENERCK